VTRVGLFLSTAFGFPTVLLTPVLLVIVVYWIARNLPWEPFTYLAP
jgi:hypothetical protein